MAKGDVRKIKTPSGERCQIDTGKEGFGKNIFISCDDPEVKEKLRGK